MQVIADKKNKKKDLEKSITIKTEKKSDEKWDDLMQKPESEAFLTIMLDEVRNERVNGKLIDGDW